MRKATALLTGLLLFALALPSFAITFRVRHTAESQVFLQIGSGGGTIDQVTFDVPAANLGDATPIQGDITILVFAWARARNASYVAELTADSSQPLRNGSEMLPFQDNISWTSSDTDIPGGVFNGGVQTLTTFRTSRVRYNWQTFIFRNASVLAPGTYTGRVTYTLALP